MNDMKSSIYSSVTDAVAAAKGAYSRYSKLTLMSVIRHKK